MSLDQNATMTDILYPERRKRVHKSRFRPGFLLLEDRLCPTAITSQQQTAITNGFAALKNWGDNLQAAVADLNVALPAVGTSLGSVLNLGTRFQNQFVTPIANYFATDTTPTYEELASALTGASITPNPSGAGFSLGLGQFTFTNTLNRAFDFGSGATALGLSFNSAAKINVTATAKSDVTLFVGPTATDFSLQLSNTTFDVDATSSSLNFGVTLANPSSSLTVSNGTLNISGSLNAAIDPTGDGKLSLGELQTLPAGNLAKLTVASSSLSAAATLTGSISGFGSLGTITIRAADPSLFDGADPRVTADVVLSSAMQTKILSILDNVETFGNTLSSNSALTSKLPIVDASVNEILTGSATGNAGDFLKVRTAASNYFTANPTTATIEGLLNALQTAALGNLPSGTTGSAVFGPVTISGGIDFATKTLSATVSIDAGFSKQFTVTGSSLGSQFSSAFSAVGVTLTGSSNVTVGGSFKANATAGIDLTSFLSSGTIANTDAFVSITGVQAKASLAVNDLNLSAKVGFIEGAITNGTATVQPVANVTVNSGNPVTLATLASTPISTLATFSTSGALDAILPVVVTIGAFSSAANPPRVHIQDSDIFVAPVPTVTLENLGSLAEFKDMSPFQMVVMLESFGKWLAQFNNSPAFSTTIPFTNQTVGSTISLVTSFTTNILDVISDISTDPQKPGRIPKFTTFDGMLTYIANAIRPSGPVYDWTIDPQFDATNKEFTFRFKYTAPFPVLTAPIALSYDLGGIASFSTSTTLTLTPSATFDATIGVRLAKTGNAVITGGTTGKIPSNGQLGAATSFTVDIDGTSKTINISKATTDNNTSVSDLVGDVTSALTAAGIATTTLAVSTIGAAGSERLKFELLSGNKLKITTTTTDPLVTKLAFATIASSSSTFGELFVKDVAASGSVTASAEDILATAQFGFVGIDIGTDRTGPVTPDVLAQLDFGITLTDDSKTSNKTRFTLQELIDAATKANTSIIHTDLNGSVTADLRHVRITGNALGASVTVDGEAFVSLPNAYLGFTQFSTNALPDNGTKFDGDARFNVVVRDSGNAILKSTTVTVAASAMADNTTTADLIADVDAALQAAGVNAYVDALPTLDGKGIRLVSVGSGTSFTANGLIITRFTGFTDVLDSFRNMNYADAIQLIADVANNLQDVSAFEFLGTTIPLIDKSPAELLNLAARLAKAVQDLQNNPAGSIQLLQRRLDDLLGYTTGGNPIQLGWDPAAKALTLKITYIPLSYSNDLSVNVDLQSLLEVAGVPPELQGVTGFVDVAGNGTIAVEAKATLNLDLGLILGDGLSKVQPVIYTTSGIKIEARAATTNLSFETQIGPLGLYIRNGHAAVDLDGDATTADYATFRYGLDPGAGSYINFSQFKSNLRPTLDAKAGILFPLYTPTSTQPLGITNNKLGIVINDLYDFYKKNPLVTKLLPGQQVPTVQITSLPDIASAFGGIGLFDLLKNPAIVINGIDTLLSGIHGIITSDFFSARLPIVGNLLKVPGAFIDDFRIDLVNQLRRYVAQLPTLQAMIDNIRLGFVDILGPAGINILLDVNLDNIIDINDLPYTLSGNVLQFDLNLGQVKTFSFPAGFDLGLDALGLTLDANVDLTFGWKGYLGFGLDATQGFFIATDALGKNGGKEFSVDFKAEVTGSAQGRLGFLQIDAKTIAGKPTEFVGQYAVDILDVATVASDSKLTMAEFASRGTKKWLDYGPTANASVNLDLKISTTAGGVAPSLGAEFWLDWSFAPSEGKNGGVPAFGFKGVYLDLGSFLSDFVKPIVDKIDSVLDPIDPILDIMLDPLPIISELSGEDVSLLYLAAIYNGMSPATARKVVDAIIFIRQLIDDIAALPSGSPVIVNFGDFDLGSFDPRGKTDSKSATVNTSANSGSLDTAFSGSSGKAASITSSLRSNSNTTFVIPMLKNPKLAFDLLMGKDVSLVEVTLPALDITFNYHQFFSIFGPLGGNVDASFSLYVGATFGYDTYGYHEYVNSGRLTDMFDGFYVVADPNRPNVVLNGEISVGASIDLGVASGGVSGGLGATITMNLNDPNNDGKLRGKELVEILEDDPLCLFEAQGTVYARLYAWYEYLFGLGGDSVDIVPPITLATFSYSCDETPILAEVTNGTMLLSAGFDSGTRLWNDNTDGDDHFTVVDRGGGTMDVTFISASGKSYTSTYTGVSKIVMNAGEGNNYLDARGVSVPVYYTGGSGTDTVYGGDGNDVIDCKQGDAIVSGGGGDDTITVAPGLHKIAGGAGTDTLTIVGDQNFTFSQSSFAIGDFTGAWKINPGDALDPVEGLFLTGGDSGNVFTLTGWTGNATLDGEEGRGDKIIVGDDLNYVLTDTTLVRNGLPTVNLISLEKAELTGGASNNTFTVTGWTGSGVINGAGGKDTIIASNDADFFLTNESFERTEHKSFSLSNMEHAILDGGTSSNTFDISNWTGTGSLDGHAGTDTVTEFNDFHYVLTDALLTRSGGGDIALASLENGLLTGGNSDNTFDVSGWSGTGKLDGLTGRDDVVAVNNENFVLSDSNLARSGGTTRGDMALSHIGYAYLMAGNANNNFDVSGWTGLGFINAGAGQDTLTSNGDYDYTITGGGYDRTAGGRFTTDGLETVILTGGASNNTFTLDGFAGNGTINSGGGTTDSLVVVNDTNVVLADSMLERSGSGDFSLVGLTTAYLLGGAADNSFIVSDWSGKGSVFGNGGTDQLGASGHDAYLLTDTAFVSSNGASLTLDHVDTASLVGTSGDGVMTLDGWTGKAWVDGGGGRDALSVAADADFAVGATSITTSDGAVVELSSVERLELLGGTGDNAFSITGWEGNTYINGGVGHDSISGIFNGNVVLSDHTTATFNGAGNPTITLNGIEEAVLSGGAGDQTFDVSNWSGQGFLLGGGGHDVIVGYGDGSFSLADNQIINSVGGHIGLSGFADARLTGGTGNDRFDLTGWTGLATINGNSGNDEIVLITDSNFTATTTHLKASQGPDVTLQSVESLYLVGGAGDNDFDVTGWSGRLTLRGNGGNDTVYVGNAATNIRLSDSTLAASTGILADLQGIRNAFLYGTAADDVFDLSGWTGVAHVNGGGASQGDTINYVGDHDYTLDSVALSVSNGGKIWYSGDFQMILGGGLGNNRFDLSGWNARATLIGLGGVDAVRMAVNADFNLTADHLSTSLGALIGLIDIDNADLSGGMGSNHFHVSNWNGSATLDGGDGADDYEVIFHGVSQGDHTVITDSGLSGSDGLRVLPNPGGVLLVNGSQIVLSGFSDSVDFSGIESVRTS